MHVNLPSPKFGTRSTTMMNAHSAFRPVVRTASMKNASLTAESEAYDASFSLASNSMGASSASSTSASTQVAEPPSELLKRSYTAGGSSSSREEQGSVSTSPIANKSKEKVTTTEPAQSSRRHQRSSHATTSRNSGGRPKKEKSPVMKSQKKGSKKDNSSRSSSDFSSIFRCGSGTASVVDDDDDGEKQQQPPPMMSQFLAKSLYTAGVIETEADFEVSLAKLSENSKSLLQKVQSAVQGGYGTCQEGVTSCREVTPTKEDLLIRIVKNTPSQEEYDADLVTEAIKKRERLHAAAKAMGAPKDTTDKTKPRSKPSTTGNHRGKAAKNINSSSKSNFDRLVSQLQDLETIQEDAIRQGQVPTDRIVSIQPLASSELDIAKEDFFFDHKEGDSDDKQQPQGPPQSQPESKPHSPLQKSFFEELSRCHSSNSILENVNEVTPDKTKSPKKTKDKRRRSPRRSRRKRNGDDIPKVIISLVKAGDSASEEEDGDDDDQKQLIPSKDQRYRKSDDVSLVQQHTKTSLPKALGQKLICRSRKEEEEALQTPSPSRQERPVYRNYDDLCPPESDSSRPLGQRLFCKSHKDGAVDLVSTQRVTAAGHF